MPRHILSEEGTVANEDQEDRQDHAEPLRCPAELLAHFGTACIKVCPQFLEPLADLINRASVSGLS